MEELKSVQGFYITRMGGPLMWGVTREKRGSRSSCIAELKAIDEGIKGIQFLRKLMEQLGLPDVHTPTPILNDNQGSLDWIESGCRPSKKLRHENLAELGIAEAKQHDEVTFHWVAGKVNPSDIFTKEDNDVGHYQSLRDMMVASREHIYESSQVQWGVLKQGSSCFETCTDPVMDDSEIDVTQWSKDHLTSNQVTKTVEVLPTVAISTE